MSGDSGVTYPIVSPNGTGGHRPEFVPVDRDGNVIAAGGGGGGGASGTVSNPGVNGTNAQAVQGINGGVPLPSLPQASEADWSPGYGIDPGGLSQLSVEPNGAAKMRGLVLTDEGSYRCNFANASTQVAIGNAAFTNGSKVVSGGAFTTVDLHHGDYVRLAADAESALAQVDTITATGLVLMKPYTGAGGTGAAIRQILRTMTGAGATISVASGQCTIAAGTTASAVTEAERDADFLPLAKRCSVSISQRIANQDIHIGLYDTANAIPLYFAWFRFSGVSNTTVICETALNPTTAPSVAETETTTVTIPNGGTTAGLRRYQVELFGDKARFFIDGILVAEHTRSLPRPSDVLGSTVRVVNGAVAPASNTNIVIDYDSCQNFNRLQVGGASDGERLVAESAPLAAFVGSTAVLNGDVLVIDCLQHRAILLQILGVFVGTASFQASNDPTFATTIAQPAIPSAGGAPVTSSTGVGHWVLPVVARYLRIRATAYTSGTMQATAFAAQTPPLLPTMNVNGTVTATVAAATITGGTVAEDAAAGANPLITGGVVRAAVPGATFVAGDAVRDTMTTWGAKVVAPWAVPEAVWGANLPLTTTTPAVIQTAAGAGLKRHVVGVQAINTGAAVAELIILDGVTERWRLPLPVNVPVFFEFPVPVTVTANTALNANLSVAGTVRANFQGFTAP